MFEMGGGVLFVGLFEFGIILCGGFGFGLLRKFLISGGLDFGGLVGGGFGAFFPFK